MFVNVTVNLADGDAELAAADVAIKVLEALAGDESKDHVSVTVASQAHVPAPPEPQPLAPPPSTPPPAA